MSEEQRLTLYSLEQHLATLWEIAEEVAPEQEAAFQLVVAEALKQSVAKRDRIVSVLEELAWQSQLEAAAIQDLETRLDRHKKRLAGIKANMDRLRQYVVRVIAEVAPRVKGKAQRIEGTTATLKACAVPPSLADDLDESLVPLKYKKVEAAMSAEAWLELSRAHSGILETSAKYSCDKRKLLEDLKAGDEIPGARLVTGKLRLVIE